MHINQEPQSSQPLQTPEKKKKSQSNSDLKTAQSPSQPSLSQIDPAWLFANFHDIVTVTESEEQLSQPQDSPYRKLEFRAQSGIRLNFDQSTASMRKKKSQNSQQRSCITIKPFLLTRDDEGKKSNFAKMDEFSPGLRVKAQRQDFSTPKRKIQRSLEIERAAKKEDPFRDLIR